MLEISRLRMKDVMMMMMMRMTDWLSRLPRQRTRTATSYVFQPPVMLVSLVKKTENCMRLCNHALYRSDVFAKPIDARVTFVKMMDITSYLHKLLANEILRDKLVQHFQSVERLLSHPACEIITQIKFDLDLIEVSNGFCFAIKSRSFIACPIPDSMHGKLSPRAFVPYDCSTPPQPLYFREGIMNSFPDVEVRVNFLNKLYQCFLAHSMPHKVKKLVVAGPKDSAKTSWSNIFHRIIPAGYIASLTNEKQFSAAMINNETQLVLVDEWSANTMQSDLAKSILQGGWMVTAVKHGQPRTILNNSPYYITTNNLPDFGKEEENVKRRIEIFTTKSLPETIPGVDRWIYDHAMDCVTWIAEEINKNRDLIARNELWYESNDAAPLTVLPNEGESLFSDDQIRRISRSDLCQDHVNVDNESAPTIHESFAKEFRSRRLARKRRANRGQTRTNDYSDEDDQEFAHSIQLPHFNSSPTSSREESYDVSTTLAEARQIVSSPSAEGQAVIETTQTAATSATIERPSVQEEQLHEQSPDKTHDQPHRPNDEQASVSDGEQEIDSFTMRIYSPPSGWTLNDKTYMRKVAWMIKYNFTKGLKKGALYSFTERRERAELRRTKNERDFWTEADPAIDAWMLVTGRSREVFDMTCFAQHHRDILPDLKEARKNVNVLVLGSRCPLQKAMAELENQQQNVTTRGDTVEVPSQSYWTTIKSWRPW